MQPVKHTGHKILIVDDDMILASIYRHKFQAAGFIVDVAESGETGLLKIAQNSPDIVLLDLMLGDMNGVEVIEVVRRNETTRHLPVVVFSSAFLGNLVEDAARAGATKCLNKASCPPNRLIDEIETILAMAATPPAPMHGPAAALRESPPPSAAAAAAPFAPPAAPPSSPAAPATHAEELHGSLRRELMDQIHRRLDEAQRTLPKWLARPNSADAPYLPALYRSLRSIAGSAALAGRLRLGQVAGAVEALLKEIKGAPGGFSDSMLRTVCQAVELMPALAQDADSVQVEAFPSPLILVLAPAAGDRAAMGGALESAMLHALAVDETGVALRLLPINRFDLVLVDLPVDDALAFCARLRATPANVHTPLILIAAPDAATRARFDALPGADFLARPVTPIELAVKALVHLHNARHEA